MYGPTPHFYFLPLYPHSYSTYSKAPRLCCELKCTYLGSFTLPLWNSFSCLLSLSIVFIFLPIDPGNSSELSSILFHLGLKHVIVIFLKIDINSLKDLWSILTKFHLHWTSLGQLVKFQISFGVTWWFASPGGRTLRLIQTRIEDAGQYACVVRNAAGEERKLFGLSVLGIYINCNI